MKKQSLRANDIANLKLIVAEHIVAQYGSYRTDDVPTILAETKVGAWRRTDLEKKLKMIFSAS